MPARAAIEVRGITADSRAVKPGDVFVAMAGSKTDGSAFAAQAAAAGAAAIVGEKAPPSLPAGAVFVQVANARRALALAAARFYRRQPATIAAVTGTSGKTSVAAFTRQIWAALGKSAASVGTIGVVTPKREVYGSLTTPDPVALHKHARRTGGRRRHASRDRSVVARARSASARRRARRGGGFTNLSRDHLDYHPTVEHYLDGQAAAVRGAGGRWRRGGDRRRPRACGAGRRGGARRAG